MGIQVIKGGSISAYLKLAGDVALSSSLVSVVDQTNTVSGLQLATASIGLTMPTFLALPNWTNTLGTKDGFSSQQTVAVASVGTGVFRLIRNAYTINNTAAQTGSVTGYFLNATQTNLNGMTHNLMDLQIASATIFRVNNVGSLFTNNFALSRDVSTGADGNVVLSNSGVTNFGLLKLGGTTSSFPAIKRNGAQIDFRLADDSGYCNLNTGFILLAGTPRLYFIDGTNYFNHTGSALTYLNNSVLAFTFSHTGALFASSGTIDASARVQIDSTTKGFLMPRMTQAQILLILTPANGLMVYNTDINTPCFYDGGALLWKKVSHSNM